MNKMKYYALIPLFLWIFLWSFTSYGLAVLTGLNVMWVLTILSFICIGDLVWWCLTMNRTKEMDLFTKIIYLIVLNLPAYFMIKKAIQINWQLDKQNDLEAEKYKLTEAENIDFDNVVIPDWEKKIIAEKQNKKANNNIDKKNETKKLDKQNDTKLLDPKLLLQRKIIRNYTKFVLFTTLKANPHLTATFDITRLVHEQFNNQVINLKLIDQYIKDLTKWNHFKTEELNLYTNIFEIANQVLKSIYPGELEVAYKQDRVDITIEVQILLNK